jgi:hypothetical protein
MSSMDHLIEQYFDEHFAGGVKVPTNVGEDDARACARSLVQGGRVAPRASRNGTITSELKSPGSLAIDAKSEFNEMTAMAQGSELTGLPGRAGPYSRLDSSAHLL